MESKLKILHVVPAFLEGFETTNPFTEYSLECRTWLVSNMKFKDDGEF
jgi:hypothetical protein